MLVCPSGVGDFLLAVRLHRVADRVVVTVPQVAVYVLQLVVRQEAGLRYREVESDSPEVACKVDIGRRFGVSILQYS